MQSSIEAEIITSLWYFYFFKYSPNLEEIHTFLKKKCSKQRLTKILETMAGKKILRKAKIDARYTHGEYSIIHSQQVKSTFLCALYPKKHLFSLCARKRRISIGKIKKISHYIRILSLFPQIQLVGLSGSLSMLNATRDDDIDLCIIASENRMWTARLISLMIAQIFGLRRKSGEKRASDKVCLNLFFDACDMQVPKHKRTEYVAHEILQMKPLINKNNTYGKFLVANKWIYRIFPNAKTVFCILYPVFSNKTQNILGNIVEKMLKKLELISIRKHQTSEIVTNTQLWFFPEDFEQKIKEGGLI